MTETRITLALLIFGAAACVSKLPLEQSRCPCPEAMGVVCCQPTGLCVSSSEAASCQIGSGGSGTGGSSIPTGGTGGTNLVDAGGADAPAALSPVVSVGIGAAHACVVRADGTISCMGSNAQGQATPPPGYFFTQVVAGAEHTCAQTQDLTDRTKNGAWVCWGDNTYGQATPPAGPLDYVAAGGRHNCSISSGQVACWGDNSSGQSAPPASAAQATAVSAGRLHTCAIVTGSGDSPDAHVRQVVCWGDNSLGQSTPPTLSNDLDFLAAGGDHTCVSGFGGSLACWGENDSGQSTAPVGNIRSLSVASGHSCGMPFDGTSRIQCWGTDWGTSKPMPPTGMFNNVFAGDYLNCGLPVDPRSPLVCWGQSYEPWY